MQWWANQARSWLLGTLTFRIIWSYQSIFQRVSLSLCTTHPAWRLVTNELDFYYYRHQINSLSLVNLLLLINKFSFICEWQSCRIRLLLIVAMCLPLPNRLSNVYIHRVNCIVYCAILIWSRSVYWCCFLYKMQGLRHPIIWNFKLNVNCIPHVIYAFFKGVG